MSEEKVPLGPDGKPEKKSFLLKLKADAAFEKAVEAQEAVGGQRAVLVDGNVRYDSSGAHDAQYRRGA